MTLTVPKTKLSDLQLLGRLKGLAWLSSGQLKSLDASMTFRNVKHKDIIFEERGARSQDTYILLSGTAELCHLDGTRSRVVAIMSPGVLFRMPMMALGVDHTFQWTALNDCRVAQLTTNSFINISLGIRAADFLKMADSDHQRWAYLMGRYPSFVRLGLSGRVAVALLELSVEFGVQETRGILIRIALSQRQLADLVGASRAKVGQVLRDLERKKIVVRDGHHLAVVTRRLEAMVRFNGRMAA
jgi:CRP/FNR family transcriptional regulator, cyclic AMP receptor protein